MPLRMILQGKRLECTIVGGSAREYTGFTEEKKRKYLADLRKISAKARITPALKRAVDATIKALEQNDLHLASALTSVKSLIEGGYGRRRTGPFAEDAEYNSKILGGEDVYIVLDGLHHKLAWTVGEMPSGMMVISAGGVAQRGVAPSKHPVVQQINREFARIRRRR